MTGDLSLLHVARDRLAGGEPIRILIGHTLHAAMEIEPAAAFVAGIRASLLDDIEAHIADLTPPDDPPAAPAAALSAERTD